VWVVGLEGEYQAVEGQFEDPVGIVDPGQLEMGSAVMNRLGDLGRHLDDPAADARFEALLTIPALRTFLAPRMATHGLAGVRGYVRDLLRYTSQDTAPAITCPGYVTGNQTGTVSAGQGKALFGRLTCPREFRLFTRAEGRRRTLRRHGTHQLLDRRLRLARPPAHLNQCAGLRNPCRPVQRSAVSVNPDAASHGEQTALNSHRAGRGR